MTKQHTPGPWIGAGPSFGDQLPRYTTEIMTEYEYEDGEVRSICELPFAHHDDENEANARLIAAAPELLEALQNALTLLEEYEVKLDREFGGASSLEELDACGSLPIEIREARAAIAKATGESK